MSEIELKFGLGETAARAVEAALRGRGARPVEVASHYWDSADRRLARAGLSLRLRRVKGRWEQTVKAAGAGPVERLEETVSRPGEWSDSGPPPDLGCHAGREAGALLDAALTRRGGRVPPLEAAHASIVSRRALHVVVPGSDIEVAFDRGVVRAGEQSEPIREVELELKHGDPAGLIALGRAGIDTRGMWLSTIAKSARGDRLAGSAAAARAVKARAAPLHHASSGAEIFRVVVRSCVDQVLANASVIAAGDVDDETVHQLRVGLRRLRTAARELAQWRGSLGRAWETAAAQVFRDLGVYRNRRTVAASMQQCLAEAGSPDPALRPPASADAVDPVATVRAAAFQHALLDLVAFLLEPARPNGAAANAKARRAPETVIGRRLDRLQARLADDAKRFESFDSVSRHGVRKRLKRLRYLAELVGPLYRKGRVARFLKALEPAQDELGRYMDLVVAARLAQEVVEGGDPRAWFNVGWLRAQQAGAIERCVGALDRVAGAAPFW